VIYFPSEDKQKLWMRMFQEASGNKNIEAFFDFGEVLGKGQFGNVKKAKNKETGEFVAVKQIKKSKISEEELGMLRNEIEVLKMCQHPNIVQLLDIFEDSKKIHIVLELLKGGDLYDYMEIRKFKLKEPRIREIVYQTAKGLLFLHNYGIVHRDLKLQNIMMSTK